MRPDLLSANGWSPALHFHARLQAMPIPGQDLRLRHRSAANQTLNVDPGENAAARDDRELDYALRRDRCTLNSPCLSCGCCSKAPSVSKAEDADALVRVAVKACLSADVGMADLVWQIFDAESKKAFPLKRLFRTLSRFNQVDALAPLVNHPSAEVRSAVIHARDTGLAGDAACWASC